MSRPASRGFTIIEVLISITVLGIIIMLAVPSFTEFLQNQNVRSAADASLNGLQVARAEAIRRNMAVQIVFGPCAGGGCSSGWAVTEAVSGIAIQSRSADEGSTFVMLSTVPPGATTVTFTSLGGTTTNQDGSPRITRFDLTNPAKGGACQPAGPLRCLAVLVGGGGSVKMCDPIVALPDARAC